MEKLLTLSGSELFERYLNEGGEYASVLKLAYLELRDELFPLLEKAEREGKKIVIIDDIDPNILDGPVTFTLE